MALKPAYRIPELPPEEAVETVRVLKLATTAHRHLAELKGRCSSIPNAAILIDTLVMQEAKASSEIENIISSVSWPEGSGDCGIDDPIFGR